MVMKSSPCDLAVCSKSLLGRSLAPQNKLRLLVTTALVGVVPITTAALFAALAATPALADGGVGSAGSVYGGPGGTDSATAGGGAGASAPASGGGGGGGGAGVTGGNGGNGYNNGGAGAGGSGGASVGDAGGNGGDATASASGGGGGGGGAHGAMGVGLPVVPSTGGSGGSGGDGFTSPVYSDGGGGGAGGYGAVVTGSGPLGTLSFAVTAGNGGRGGSTAAPGSFGGNGGTGGIGLLFTDPMGASFTVNSAVSGGNGGAGGTTTIIGSVDGTGGGGGAAIVGQNLSITMGAAGSVTGGMSGNGATRADAITFTGGANSLTFSMATSNLTGNIGVNGGGSLTFDQSGVDTTVANVITGDGSVAKTGTSTIVLTGANSYSGGTTISAGTLQVANDNALGTGALTFTGGTLQSVGATRTIANDMVLNATARIDINSDPAFRLNGDITGASGLTVMNSSGILGTLNLAGNNSYSGLTTTTGFSLVGAGSTTAFSPNSDFDVHFGSSLALNGFDNTIRSLSGSGIVSNNTIGTAATLIIASPSGTTTFSGLIADGGATLSLVKAGAGTQVLAGDNTYTGTTTVNGGILSVNGSIASSSLTTVNADARLGGNGTVGDTSIAGGTLAPGNSIGTITVAGDLVFGAGSKYAVEVSTAAADRTNVSGKATLSGGTVVVTYLPGTLVGKDYPILNATGGLGDTKFAVLDAAKLPGLTTSLEYDSTTVHLVTASDLSALDGLNLNQRAVAGTLLNYFDVHGSLPAEFASLNANGLTLVSGELAAGAITAGLDSADKFLGALDGQLETGRGAPSQSSGANAYADEGKTASDDRFASLGMSASHDADQVQPITAHTWNVWGTAYGGSEETGGDPVVGSHDTTADTWGLLGGVSYRVDNTLVGVALGGGWSDFSLSQGLGSGSANTFNAGIYGRQGFGNAYVSGAFAYGFNDVETSRTVFGDVLSADFNAQSYSGRGEAGYRFDTPVVAIAPYAAFQATAYHLPAYSETGAGGFALNYDADTTTATRAELGARLEHAMALSDGGLLTLTGRAAWAINGGTDRNVGAAFQSLPGTAFTIDGAQPDRNAALLDAGAGYTAPSGFFAAATFQGEFSGNVQSYAGKLKIGFTW
jgi:autotransporter-associated beta strand protein